MSSNDDPVKRWGPLVTPASSTEVLLSYIPVSHTQATALKLDHETEEEAAPRSSLRGGGESEDMDTTNDSLVDDTTVMPTQRGSEQIMSGFQGTVPFNADRTNIESAVRHLLGLSPDGKGKIVLAHLDMGRLNRGEDPVIANYADDYPLDYRTVGRILAHSRATPDHTDCCRWFVRFQDEEEPETWLPSSAERQKMVTLARSGTSAYFTLPEFVGPSFVRRCGKNTYSAYMRTAMQVLLGRATKPGANHSAVAVYDRDTVPEKEARWCYGGLDLPPQVYDNLYRSVGRATPWIVQKESLSPEAVALCLEGYEQVPREDDAAPRNYELVKPAASKPPAGGRFRSAWEVLNGMVKVYLSDDIKNLPIEVSLREIASEKAESESRNEKDNPNETEGDPNEAEGSPKEVESQQEETEGKPEKPKPQRRHPGSLFMYYHEDSTHREAQVSEAIPPTWAPDLANWMEDRFNKGHRGLRITLGFKRKDWKWDPKQGTKQEWTLLPRWVLPSAGLKDQVHLLFPLESATLKEVRRSIRKLVAKHPHGVFGNSVNQKIVYITLEGVPMTKHCSPVKIVITPRTTESEFSLALEKVMSSTLVVSISSDESVDFTWAVADDATPWGPRYGDVAVFAGHNPNRDDEPPETPEDTLRQSPTANSERGSERPPPVADPGGPRSTSRPEGRSPPSLSQPSVAENGRHPSILMSAPQKESLLRTGSPNVPMVSKRVDAPTEQQRIRETFNNNHNQALGRTVTCNYKGCSFTARTDDMEGMQRHLDEEHLVNRCPWCPTEVFTHMSQEDRERHIADEHGDKIKHLARRYPGHVHGNNRARKEKGHANLSNMQQEAMEMAHRRLQEVNRPQPWVGQMAPKAPERADDREGVYIYCDRCGRQHEKFTDKERWWHDELCVPRAQHVGDLSWCKICGEKVWKTRELSRRYQGQHVAWPHSCDPAQCKACGGKVWGTRELSVLYEGEGVEWPHSCGPSREGNTNGENDPDREDDPGLERDPRYDPDAAPYCSKCRYAIGSLETGDVNGHEAHCKGFSGKVGQFCPYCGVPMGYIRNHAIRERHMIFCDNIDPVQNRGRRTSTDGTPYAIYPRCMWDEQGPRPEDDQFYTGWRTELLPGAWAPNGSDRATSHEDASQATTLETIRRRAAKVLAQPKGGRVRAARTFTPSEETDTSFEQSREPEPWDEPDFIEAPSHEMRTGGKRPARGGKQSQSKRRKVADDPAEEPAPPRTEPTQLPREPTLPTTEPVRPAQEPAPPTTEPARSAQEPAPPAQEPAPPVQDPAQPAQEKAQSLKEPGQPVTADPRRPQRKRLPTERALDATRAPPKEMTAAQTAKQPKELKKLAPPEQAATDGDEDPDFAPADGMFCSRCFRKVPGERIKLRDGDPSFAAQMEAHMDPNGGCRIRRGRGSIDAGLPNRSGWLHEADLARGEKAVKLKVAFYEEYPAYRLTIYPVTGQTTQSVWKHDPNNAKDNPESVRLSRALPIPPNKNATAELAGYTAAEKEIDQEGGDADGGADNAPEEVDWPEDGAGQVPPGKEERQGRDEGPGDQEVLPPEDGKAAKGALTKKVAKINDKTWRDRGEELSEDEEPDPEAVRADDPQGGPTPPKKKRKAVAKAAPATTPVTAATAEDGGTTQGAGKQTKIKVVKYARKRSSEEERDQPEPKKAKTRAQPARGAGGREGMRSE